MSGERLTVARLLKLHAFYVFVTQYGMSISEAARVVGLPRATAYRLAREWWP